MWLKRFWDWLAFNRVAARDWTVAVGAISIPLAIYFGQGIATNRHEKSSRLVGITQLLSSTYSKTCKEQWDTYNLVKNVFPNTVSRNDDSTFVPFLNQLALDAHKNPHCPPDVKIDSAREAQAANQESKKNLSSLNNFDVDIFVPKDAPQYLTSRAEEIQKELTQFLLKTKINLRRMNDNFFIEKNITDNQIRYHKKTEEEATRVLLEILSGESGKNPFALHPLYRDKTPYYISVFIVR